MLLKGYGVQFPVGLFILTNHLLKWSDAINRLYQPRQTIHYFSLFSLIIVHETRVHNTYVHETRVHNTHVLHGELIGKIVVL
jgi:hypothetical protein